jgi:hypothetical protein
MKRFAFRAKGKQLKAIPHEDLSEFEVYTWEKQLK